MTLTAATSSSHQTAETHTGTVPVMITSSAHPLLYHHVSVLTGLDIFFHVSTCWLSEECVVGVYCPQSTQNFPHFVLDDSVVQQASAIGGNVSTAPQHDSVTEAEYSIAPTDEVIGLAHAVDVQSPSVVGDDLMQPSTSAVTSDSNILQVQSKLRQTLASLRHYSYHISDVDLLLSLPNDLHRHVTVCPAECSNVACNFPMCNRRHHAQQKTAFSLLRQRRQAVRRRKRLRKWLKKQSALKL